MRHRTIAATILGCVLFVATLALNLRGNDFPHFYHGDETSKAKQLVGNSRNLRHPVLLLNTADLIARLTGTKDELQEAIVTARATSALYGAVAVLAFSLLALRLYGLPAMFLTGALVMANPLLLETAHYAKEDPALIGGMALTFLAMQHYWITPSLRSAILLGAAAGLTLSAKYIGVTILFPAVIALLLPGRDRWDLDRPRRLALFIAAGALLFSLLNFQMFFNPAQATTELQKQTVRTVGIGNDDSPQLLFRVFGAMLRAKTAWPVAVLFVTGVALLVHRRWPRPSATKNAPQPILDLALLFPILYFVMICLAERFYERYLLPVTVFVSLGAALTAGALFLQWPGRGSRQNPVPAFAAALSLVLCILALASELPRSLKLSGQYLADDRKTLFRWVRDHLPDTAVVAQNDAVHLDDLTPLEGPLPQKLVTAGCLADLGTVDDLRRNGVTHVITAEVSYLRYFRRSAFNPPYPVMPRSKQTQFYSSLNEKAELLWEQPLQEIQELHPGLRLFQLSTPNEQTQAP